MQLHTINTGLFKLDGGAMHGVVPKTMWNKVNPADENNMCSWAMRCLLVEDGDKLILIDTGMGQKQDGKFFSYFHPHGEDTLLNSIRKAGYSPNDITDVFLTHLHFDHCGGAIERKGDALIPTFAHARYWSNEAHWQTAIKPNAREKASFLAENILPIQQSGQLHFVTMQEGIAFSEHIHIHFVQGHTEAMMLPRIRYKNTEILFCADLIPSAAHVSLPWVMAYDMRPLDTLSEKERFLKLAADEQYVLFLEHDLHTEVCTLMHTDKGIRIGEKMTLSTL